MQTIKTILLVIIGIAAFLFIGLPILGMVLKGAMDLFEVVVPVGIVLFIIGTLIKWYMESGENEEESN